LYTDKILHFIAGLVVYSIFVQLGVTWGIVAVLVAGFGKELYDLVSYGVFDEWDFFWTIAGGVTAAWALTP